MPLFVAIYLSVFAGKALPIFQYVFVAFLFYAILTVSAVYLYSSVFSGGAVAETIYLYKFFE